MIIKTLNNWHHRTDFSSFTAILIQPIFMLFRFNCQTLLRKKWTVSFCCCFIMNKGKEQIQQMKWELISKATYAKPWNVHSSISLYSLKGLTQKLLISMLSDMTVIRHTYFRLVSIPLKFFFLTLTACLEVLVYEVTFIASLRLHNNFSLRQNGIFRIIDAKTWPRLNTAHFYFPSCLDMFCQ